MLSPSPPTAVMTLRFLIMILAIGVALSCGGSSYAQQTQAQNKTFEESLPVEIPGIRSISPRADFRQDVQQPEEDASAKKPSPSDDARPKLLRPLPDEQPKVDPYTGTAVRKLDARELVLERHMKELPFSAIGRLVVEYSRGGQKRVGTGFLIAPGVVMTAAHVLQSETQGIAARVSFTPGCSIALSAGSRARAISQSTDRSHIRISSGWRAGSLSIEFDYGLVFLPDKALFAPCGVLPLDAPENDFFNKQAAERAQSFFVAGFPNDPELDQDKQIGTMWFGRGGLRGAGINSVRHLIDTTPGQSGGPLFIIGKSKANGQNIPLVLAIHSRPPVAGREYNISRRIDKKILDNVSRWLNEFGYSQ